MEINGSDAGRLLCVGGADAHGKRRPTSRPAQIRVGTIDELVAYVDEQDRDDLWRYTIVRAGDDHHIMGADLRALLPTRANP